VRTIATLGKAETDAQARSVVLERERGAVKVGDGRGQGQAEAAARRAAAAVQPYESLQDLAAHVFGDARSVVGNSADRPRWPAVADTLITVPAGVWWIEFSIRLARSWVSSSRSP
jgi:hypothetical protein